MNNFFYYYCSELWWARHESWPTLLINIVDLDGLTSIFIPNLVFLLPNTFFMSFHHFKKIFKLARKPLVVDDCFVVFERDETNKLFFAINYWLNT